MKKYLVFGIMGALALGFTACSSEEEVAVNPTFDGKAVKTEFALNLPSKVATRQTGAITQDKDQSGTFRGITAENLHVFPYAVSTAADNDPVKSASSMIGAKLTLEAIPSFDHANAQDKWTANVAVPVGTNAFLVYAKATPVTGDAVNGALIMNGVPEGSAKDVAFELKAIPEDEVALATAGAKILTALNALANAEGKGNPTGTKKAWKAMTEDDDNLFYARLFATFKTLTAGSKTSVEAFLADLENTITKVPANAGDDGIDKALLAILEDIDLGEDFTADAGIPDGAAVITWNDTEKAFEFVETKFVSGTAWGVNDYVYPAELWYRANTGLREDAELQSQNVQSLKWDQFIKAAYQEANNTVKASSQSVALVNPLQYAVGNFESWIAFEDDHMLDVTTTTYTYEMEDLLDDEGNPVKDDDGNIIQTPKLDADGKPIVVSEEKTTTKEVPISGLELTGILVGDQKNVDWECLPVADNDAQVIYDTELINTTFDKTSKVAAQTLVLQTAQDVVNVALEFKNNTGIDFVGVDGQIIPAGTKFYLIGQLDKDKGTPNGAEEIFQQDFKTIARFLIKTLKGTAYNVVPDLRTPELEFGLSVDLEWQKGYEFDITVGE